MRIQHNVMAMNAYRNYTNNVSAMKKNLERLSSGYKINRAGDDAAGLAISEKMRAQITGLQTAQKNAKDGISLVQTAEGALTEVHDILNRMVELATQSANGTYDNTTDRAQMEKELNQLKDEIDRIADASNFNGIKLLDGSLGESTSKAMELNTLDAVDMTDGITINAPVDGAGQKASKTFNFSEDAAFGTGDKLEITYTDNTDPDAPTTATVTLTYGTEITGTSLEDQINSIVSGLTGTTAITDNYDVTAVTNADGDVVGIEFKAKNEGVPDVTIDSLKVTDKQITAAIDSTTPGANGSSATITDALAQGWENAFGPAAATGTTAATDISVGDVIQANFVVNGTTMTVSLKAVAEGTTAGTGEFALGTSISATVASLVSAMQNASFDDDTATAAIDESLMKVSDFFTLTDNKDAAGATAVGSIQVAASTNCAAVPTAANGTGAFTGLEIGDLSIKRASAGTAGTFTTAASAAGTAGAYAYTTTAVTGSFQAKIDNMAAGDSFTINGTLRDGRTFSITLTEGTDFDMGTTTSATISAIAAALTGTTAQVSITDPATNDSVSVTANEVFGSGKEFTLGTGSAASGLLTITAGQAGMAGKGVAGSISSVVPSKANALTVTEDTSAAVSGKDPSTSENTVSFDPAAIEQGTTIEIDGKTYEFVDAGDAQLNADDADGISGNLTKEGNIAVAVTGLNARTATGQNIAEALKDAMLNGTTQYSAANGKAYDVAATEGKLTITSDGTGTGNSPLEVKMGASKPTSSLTFVTDSYEKQGVTMYRDEANVKVGDTVTINGKVYEFTDDKRTKNEDAIGVSIKDIKNADGKVNATDLAKALANAVNENDDKIIARADGKSVIFTSEYNSDAAKVEDSYKAPSIELPKSFNSLSLQIGDTADSYNQLSVSINDCHVDTLGLKNVTIADQDSARAAIQTIRDAINKVSDIRGTLGATQNRLDHTINNLSVMTENIQDAESSIRDVDVAEEMMAYTKNNILIQSAQAMLAQANQVPQGVLQLLQ